MQAPTPECSNPIHLPPILSGRLVLTAHDPCEELKYIRLTLSDGDLTSGCDRLEGRETVGFREKKQLEAVLRERIKPPQITIIGRRMPGKCRPTMLCATDQ
jgi:hypothetical protein